MPKGKRGGKRSADRIKVNIQLFAKKRSGGTLPKKEYGKIIREIDDLYYGKYEKEKVFYHYSGNYKYEVRNFSYNNYIIQSKIKIK